MTFLPIVNRELRVASRRKSTYWLRFWLALGALAVWFFLLGTSPNTSSARLGPRLFVATGVLALGFCMFAGVFVTADCLSEEKREGTFGLLFLTDLNGYDVVLGKLIATSLPCFYGLLAVLPMLALPLLMGGVTAGEFWRVTLVLMVTLLGSLSLAMMVSALSRETRQATSTTLLALIVLAGVLPAVWWLKDLTIKSANGDLLLWASPPYLYVRTFDAYFGSRTGGQQFWGALITQLTLIVGSLALASWYVPRSWQENETRHGTPNKVGLWQRMRFGSADLRARRRSKLQPNPFYWIASRDQGARVLAWLVVAPLFIIWAFFYAGCLNGNSRTLPTWFMVAMFLTFGLHQLLKWFVATEASRRLSEDHHSGALELLMVTPISFEEICSGQRRALWEAFRGPMALVLLINAGLFWLVILPRHLKFPTSGVVFFCEVYLGGAVMMLLDFYALGWVGMWMALQTKKHPRAILGTLARVVLAPWIALLLFFFLIVNSKPSEDTFPFVLFLWFCVTTVIEFVFAARARTGLQAALGRGGR